MFAPFTQKQQQDTASANQPQRKFITKKKQTPNQHIC